MSADPDATAVARRRRGACGLVILAALGVAACAGEDVPSASPTAVSTSSTSGAAVPTSAVPGATSPPSTSVAPASTAPPTTAATATTVPPTTAPPTTASTATSVPPTTAARPDPVSGIAVVSAGSGGGGTWQRVGIWDGTQWVDLADDAPSPAPSSNRLGVASVDLPGVLPDVPYGVSDFACIDEPLHSSIAPDVAMSESPLGWGYQAVAVTGEWPLQPRPVAAVGLEADVYQQVGEALLAGRAGLDPSNGDVVQVLRVDLDGNGTEEVLVSFRHLSAPDFGAVGDFSIVYLRAVRADGTVDDQIVFEYLVPEPSDPPFPAPGRASVAAVADLNGDGRMEVAIRSSYWEYSQIDVSEFVDGGLEVVMRAGCGV